MSYKAVLFDLDGTLLDTLDDLADSMNLVLERLGFPGHDVQEYKYFVGDGVVTLACRALPENRGDEETIAQCVAAMREEYGLRWAYKTRPYDGIRELLDALTKRGIPMSILSNKPDDFTKFMVEKLLPKFEFAAVMGEQPGISKKPNPVGALEIARQLRIFPEDFLYLGDTNTDMQTAIAARMFPVGALWGFRTAEELTSNGAKAVIEKPSDLLKFF